MDFPARPCRLTRATLVLALLATVAAGALFSRRAASARDDPAMRSRAFGTCPTEVQDPLRWNADRATANRICCHNRHYAEWSGYWETSGLPAATRFSPPGAEITFRDSVTGKPLFIAPRGRTMEQFLSESRAHGWPSFRDAEVVRENVVVIEGGETVRHIPTPLWF